MRENFEQFGGGGSFRLVPALLIRLFIQSHRPVFVLQFSQTISSDKIYTHPKICVGLTLAFAGQNYKNALNKK